MYRSADILFDFFGLAFVAAIVLGCVLFGLSFSWANIDDTKAHACAKWSELGYRCQGYEGWQTALWLGGPYGGAKVWHNLTRADTPGIIYTGSIQKWGDEYQVYGPKAINAISTPK